MKLCNHPGCKAIIELSLSRCEKHQITRASKSYLSHQFFIIDGRRQYLYTSSKWRKLAKKHKEYNPICCHCEKRGRIVPVDVTDHTIPVEVEPARIFDWNNLQSLCSSCHNTKTAEDNRKYGLAPEKRFKSPFKSSTKHHQ